MNTRESCRCLHVTTGMMFVFLFVLGRPAEAQMTFLQQTRQLADLTRQGRYDEVIDQVTALLDAAGQPNATLLYLRGRAEWQLSWFGAAETDLRLLGDFAPWPQWEPASEFMQKIEQLRKAAPKQIQEIKDRGHVIFRIYYDEDDDWSQAIRELLPKAYKIGQDVFGVQMYETAVFIFKDSERMAAFMRLRFDEAPRSWEWAISGRGIMLFCEADPQMRLPEMHNTKSSYFRGIVPHEYTHAIVARGLGTAQLPTWLNEGLAVYVGSKLAPGDVLANNVVMRRVFADNVVLPMDQLSANALFYGSVEAQMTDRARHGNVDSGPDAYHQGFSMTRYLLSHYLMRDVFRLLDLFKQTHNFDNSFQDAFNISPINFYAAWLQATKKATTKASLNAP